MNPDDLKRNPAVLNLYRSHAKLDKRGSELIGRCPFPDHKDDTASFTVYQYEGIWLYKCFGCQSAGNALQFIQKIDNCNFKRACEIVEEFCGVRDKEVAEKVFQPYAKDEPKRTFTLAEYKRLEDELAKNTFVQNWLLQERGIGMPAAQKLHFGFKQDISSFAGDEKIADIIDKGWISLPVIEDDKVVAIEFRSIMRKEVRKMPNMKTATLLGCHLIDPLEPVWVCEGGFDCAILVQAGFIACSLPNASTAPTPEMFDLLEQAEYVVLAGDSDPAGIQAMEKLRKGIKTPVFAIRWSQGCKDATDCAVGPCKREKTAFQMLLASLLADAKAKPMPGVYSVQHSLATAEHARLIDHPDRLRFPWPSVDSMSIILPGTVTTVFSSQSGQGKSTWVFQASIYAAKEHKQVVLNYQAELTSHQIDTIFTSHLLKKDRLNLEEEDYKRAGQILGPDFRYYIGRDTSLTTTDQVLALIESGVKTFHPDIVILDNLGFLCRGTGSDVYKQQAAAMQKITNMSAQYGLKFIVVHQSRKADQNHKGKTSHVSDLDGTKAIENDSSTIFVMHRDEIKGNKDGPANENEFSPITEISVKKFRDKGPGSSYTKLLFAGKICSFGEMVYEAPFKEPETETESLF